MEVRAVFADWRAWSAGLALLAAGAAVTVALRSVTGTVQSTEVFAPTVRPPSAIAAPQGVAAITAPTHSFATQAGPAKPVKPSPLATAKTFEEAIQRAREAPQPTPPPAIAQAKSLPEAFEAMLAAQREANGDPPPGQAAVNPFAAAAK